MMIVALKIVNRTKHFKAGFETLLPRSEIGIEEKF